MKKLDQKDLLLSPKVVTDLSDGSSSDGEKATHTCPQTLVTCNEPSNNGQCLTLEEEGCLTKKCATKDCLTVKETCVCTKLCQETHSQDVQCCTPTEQVETRCCLTPPISAIECELSDEAFCPVSDTCEETEVCPTPDITNNCATLDC